MEPKTTSPSREYESRQCFVDQVLAPERMNSTVDQSPNLVLEHVDPARPSNTRINVRRLSTQQTKSRPSPEEAVETIARLRAERRYEEAVRFIEARLENESDPRAIELFMFELAALLERPLGERSRACAVWRAYLDRFPGGRYEASARQGVSNPDCGR
jgi:hypothetical protein